MPPATRSELNVPGRAGGIVVVDTGSDAGGLALAVEIGTGAVMLAICGGVTMLFWPTTGWAAWVNCA